MAGPKSTISEQAQGQEQGTRASPCPWSDPREQSGKSQLPGFQQAGVLTKNAVFLAGNVSANSTGTQHVVCFFVSHFCNILKKTYFMRTSVPGQTTAYCSGKNIQYFKKSLKHKPSNKATTKTYQPQIIPTQPTHTYPTKIIPTQPTHTYPTKITPTQQKSYPPNKNHTHPTKSYPPNQIIPTQPNHTVTYILLITSLPQPRCPTLSDLFFFTWGFGGLSAGVSRIRLYPWRIRGRKGIFTY